MSFIFRHSIRQKAQTQETPKLYLIQTQSKLKHIRYEHTVTNYLDNSSAKKSFGPTEIMAPRKNKSKNRKSDFI